jgi:sigma-B regulation protein RsbU (phosphoserine phosphatase)
MTQLHRTIEPDSSNQPSIWFRTIGFMIDGIYAPGGYHNNLWRGILEATRQHKLNLVTFTGGPLRDSIHNDYEHQRNVIYELITPKSVDGLIVSSATLSYAAGLDRLAAFCARLRRLPSVSIGLPLDDMPCLLVDNCIGMTAALDHLIETHACRRIAFICGPQSNPDASERYLAYQAALAAHNLAFDPELVVPGDFTQPAGEAAVRLLVDQRRVGFDAVVASNDSMALGVLAALQARGLPVPESVAVVGFDDIDDARISLPSLTTVRQPIYEMGVRAVQLLLRQMAGRETPAQEVLPTELVVRNSCGCSLRSQPLSLTSPGTLETSGLLDPAQREDVITQMVKALRCPAEQRSQAKQQAAQLLETVTSALVNGIDTGKFKPAFNNILIAVLHSKPVLPWHRAIAVLSQYTLASAANNLDLSRAVNLWQWVWHLTSEIEWLSLSFQQLHVANHEEAQSGQLRRVSQALVTSFDLQELIEAIGKLLPEVGIRCCWISLYDPPGMPSRWARLQLAYDEHGRTPLPQDGGQRYPAGWLVPRVFLSTDPPYSLFVNALFFRETVFGFAVFGMEEPDEAVYETVSTQISAALQGARVVDELRQAEAELRRQANTDPLTGIYNRRILFSLAQPAIDYARRYKRPLAAAMIDLDNFKRVNDNHGHGVGDQVLRTFASYLQSHVRASDILGRFGGEEFLIIMPETTLEQATGALERIRQSLAEAPVQAGDLHVPLSISVGVAALDFTTDLETDQLVDKADQGLYIAKQAGRNRVAVYDPAVKGSHIKD